MLALANLVSLLCPQSEMVRIAKAALTLSILNLIVSYTCNYQGLTKVAYVCWLWQTLLVYYVLKLKWLGLPKGHLDCQSSAYFVNPKPNSFLYV